MKKIFSLMFTLLCVGTAFTSCDDDDKKEGIINANPEQTFVGTYSGTWTVKVQGNDEAQFVDGSVVIDTTNTAYVCKVTVNVPSYIEGVSARSNIVETSNGVIFYNYVDKTVGTAGFTGSIGKDGGVAMEFSQSVKVPGQKKKVNTSFKFGGK